MSDAFLDTSIDFLKGVGPARAVLLKQEADLSTYRDLLNHFPFRYVDRSQFHKVRDIASDLVHVQLKGKIVHLAELGKPRQTRLVALFEDDTGQIELVWFKGVKWVKPTIKTGQEYIVFGKPSQYRGKYNIAHPELETEESNRLKLGSQLMPVYSSSEKLGARGLNSRGLQNIITNLLLDARGKIADFVPRTILDRLKLPSREEAFFAAHAPSNAQELEKAKNRLKFDELFLIQLQLLHDKFAQTRKIQGPVFAEVGALFLDFFQNQLPFELTGAQKKVMKEIRGDVRHGMHMNRLLQGDVGSGKTVVALLSALLAIDNGFQVCIMAPTEILAQQHYRSISALLGEMPIMVGLLTGSTKTAARKEIHYGLESGTLHILVGTHALIEPKVKFARLGLAVIDEQHRFGVEQRSRLWKKSAIPPHVLVMTATPIPRTLAMTLYGDLDISVIDELPPGRKPVDTRARGESKRLEVFGFVEKQIKLGRQIYFVYPLIEESEAMDYKDLMDGYESIVRRFPLPEYKVSILHGKMKPEDKEYEMQQFVKGVTHIMVSTTVIEVGVDVPNASVMVIESAERFGLSQLHQLRGRVGRGADQSYCLLLVGHKVSKEARIRIDTMTRTNDGFEVAEVDLQLRGPGNLMGTQQSGVLDLKMANIVKDQNILKAARHLAEELLEKDGELTLPENQGLKQEILRIRNEKHHWGLIS